VHTHKQGVDGVMAVAAINVGEMQLHAVVMLPAAPARAAGGAKREKATCGPHEKLTLCFR
jgi:hypothetical protein